ncbi:O-fucosyltransferase [Quillaja saponaria]|uniref:O-fucosyltransferase n=1 Tax=Quillaja saponaria TaxID=32244 RepID=A0AAD7KY58_QUISA|nr:O-fucosyltransferase [Quillaja saponaria]
MKDYQIRYQDILLGGSDPATGRRMIGSDYRWNSKTLLIHGLKSDCSKYSAGKGLHGGKRNLWFRKHMRSIAFMFQLMGLLFLLDSLMVSIFDYTFLQHSTTHENSSEFQDRDAFVDGKQSPVQMYDRLLNLAASALKLCFMNFRSDHYFGSSC